MSARLGTDPALVQAAGGNTSIKCGDRMWVKASGTWLAEAGTRDVMVPVRLGPLRERIRDRTLVDAHVAEATEAGSLRASVETPFHALFDPPVVAHVHCVSTIATAIAEDGLDRLTGLLDGLDWAWQEYLKPGAPLTLALAASGAAQSRIVVLGNHGLIVSGETPEEVEATIRDVHHRLDVPIPAPGLDRSRVSGWDETGYIPAPEGPLHDLAVRPDLIELATKGPFAPDFLVFFGPDVRIVDPGATLPARLAEFTEVPAPFNSLVIVRDHGVLLRRDALSGTAELAGALYDVLARFAAMGAPHLRYFDDAEARALLDWDAEKYRQSLNSGNPA
ncbi:class II aldolase/adducin family protein [Palleronia aestuarii]|nr:class II aldolase/adducin family protein [Palleronia aestuarii]